MTYFTNGIFPGELKPDATVGGCIDIFENVWPNPQETIERVEQECSRSESGAFWQKATTFRQEKNQTYRTNLNLHVSQAADQYNNSLCQNIHNQFNMMLLAATLPYSDRYKIGLDMYHEGYNLLKYGQGQEYKVHYDGGTSDVGRIVSAICYLNDDYEGGELEFPNFNVKIKPQAGMLVLFPSSFPYAHIAHPVTSGTKYALVTWIRDHMGDPYV